MTGVLTALLTAVWSLATSLLPAAKSGRFRSRRTCCRDPAEPRLAFVPAATVVFRTNTREDFCSPSASFTDCVTTAGAGGGGGGGGCGVKTVFCRRYASRAGSPKVGALLSAH